MIAWSAAACCTPDVVEAMITPRGSFDAARAPPAPDYAKDSARLRDRVQRARTRFRRNAIEFGRRVRDARRTRVNPTFGKATSAAAPKSQHGGAVFFDAAAKSAAPATEH